MPLLDIFNINQHTHLGIWSIAEHESYFLRRLSLTPDEESQLLPLKGHRRLEWLAVRWLLHVITKNDQRGPVIKDEFGKPHLEPFQISISHTRAFAAAIISQVKVGIDIQVRVEKIDRIVPKFMTEAERSNVNPFRKLDFYHVYWGAKECLYKAYGRRKLNFKDQIQILPFNLEDQITGGSIVKDQLSEEYKIHFSLQPEFILVYALQKS